MKLYVDGFLEVLGVVGNDEDSGLRFGKGQILGNECDGHLYGFAWCDFALGEGHFEGVVEHLYGTELKEFLAGVADEDGAFELFLLSQFAKVELVGGEFHAGTCSGGSEA